ncbi:MAG TPA: hypothetical protein VGH73_06120 [Thermoanaerobaculia bacterium]|jgi:hypothetical protein
MSDELKQDQSPEVKIDELDDQDLDEASGGTAADLSEVSNSGCNCGCALD